MKRLLGLGVLLLCVWACSSTEEDSTTDPTTVVGDDASSVTVPKDASVNTMPMIEAAAPADHSVANTIDTGAAASDAKAPSDAPKVMEQVDASKDCVTYCTCMAKWCADKVFATGCLVECSRQTNWDLPCRQNMCHLVEFQPNNDHCTHAFGVGQCTDQ